MGNTDVILTHLGNFLTYIKSYASDLLEVGTWARRAADDVLNIVPIMINVLSISLFLTIMGDLALVSTAAQSPKFQHRPISSFLQEQFSRAVYVSGELSTGLHKQKIPHLGTSS